MNGRHPCTYRFHGQDFTLDQLSAICGIHKKVIWTRIRRQSWSVEQAVTTPWKARLFEKKSKSVCNDGAPVSFPASYRGMKEAGGA